MDRGVAFAKGRKCPSSESRRCHRYQGIDFRAIFDVALALALYRNAFHVRLTTIHEGATVHADWPAMFTWHGDKFLVEADADSAIIEAMLEYLNCGGEPARLAQIAEAVASLPQITVPGYTLVGVVADVTWTSFYTHMDGKCYEIVHGLTAEELTDESVDARLEEGDDDEP